MQDLVGDAHFLTVLMSICAVLSICASLFGCAWCRKKKNDKQQLLNDRIISLAPPITLVVHHPQPCKKNVNDDDPGDGVRDDLFTAGNILQEGAMEYSTSGVSFVSHQPQSTHSSPYHFGGMGQINEKKGTRLRSTSEMATSLHQVLEPGKLGRTTADSLKEGSSSPNAFDNHNASEVTATGNDGFSDVSLDGMTASQHEDDQQQNNARKPMIQFKVQLKTAKKYSTLTLTIEGTTDLPSARRGYDAILYDASMLTSADEKGIVDVIRPTRKSSSHKFGIENVFIFCFRDADLSTSFLRMRVYRKNERRWRTKIVGESTVPCWNIEWLHTDFLYSKELKLVKRKVRSTKQQNEDRGK